MVGRNDNNNEEKGDCKRLVADPKKLIDISEKIGLEFSEAEEGKVNDWSRSAISPKFSSERVNARTGTNEAKEDESTSPSCS